MEYADCVSVTDRIYSNSPFQIANIKYQIFPEGRLWHRFNLVKAETNLAPLKIGFYSTSVAGLEIGLFSLGGSATTQSIVMRGKNIYILFIKCVKLKITIMETYSSESFDKILFRGFLHPANSRSLFMNQKL